MDRHLFLFGGGSPFTPKFARKYVGLCSSGKIILLYLDGGDAFIPRYTSLLKELGHKSFCNQPLPSTPKEEVIQNIQDCSGIIICGGDSIAYAEAIVDTPISTAVQSAYQIGIPIAGFSAGALISPEVCVISSRDSGLDSYQKRAGLGLVRDTLIAVHFTQWNERNHLEQITTAIPSTHNYGIDENTGLYFHNGTLQQTDGGDVFTINNGSLIKIN
ncbi:Type 1 glutamine amidotransferase-like domain-containing protein [Ornithinibacillus scapharcae]|uniref:Type 1 glutamine amidotransferase-like domain-containing protein n=1 Tax=Ornithinibacillus scapharcae TaxID=1147159 RepID=UPI000225BCE2|nr:Type 1 glutamine amidotransferase-like domain-containing protein [Ornithinibacillus scapharcae]